MTHPTEIYGYDQQSLLTSEPEVQSRLSAILSDKILRFNPYTVDDESLVACAERGFWQPWPTLTQMVILHFHEIRRVEWKSAYDAIYFHIGNNATEQHCPVNMLAGKLTYLATLRQIHVEADNRSVTNLSHVKRLCGKDYFVSHALPARTINGRPVNAYRMFRLKGDVRQRAATIRRHMVESKIIMLEEILKYPYCGTYLRCHKDFIDYTAPIRNAIAKIRNFQGPNA